MDSWQQTKLLKRLQIVCRITTVCHMVVTYHCYAD